MKREQPQIKNELLSSKRIYSQAFTADSGAGSKIEESNDVKRLKTDEKTEETVETLKE